VSRVWAPAFDRRVARTRDSFAAIVDSSSSLGILIGK